MMSSPKGLTGMMSFHFTIFVAGGGPTGAGSLQTCATTTPLLSLHRTNQYFLRGEEGTHAPGYVPSGDVGVVFQESVQGGVYTTL